MLGMAVLTHRLTRPSLLSVVCLTHGLYSEFAGMINGRSVASGWVAKMKVVTVITTRR
jgi:hypothetical protein